MDEHTEIPWVSPEARRKAVQRAKIRANAKRWDIDTAIVLAVVIITVFIFGLIHISFLATLAVIIFGFGCAWIMGHRKARRYFPGYCEEELAYSAVAWKDYYRCLGIGPSTGIAEIENAFHRYSMVRDEIDGSGSYGTPLCSIVYRDAEEAYAVLSDPEAKAEYDRIFWLRYNGETADMDIPVRDEIVDLSHIISREFSEHLLRFGWRLPGLTRFQKKLCLIVVAVLCAAGITGTSVAFAMPESAFAAPFRSTADALTTITDTAAGFIDDLRSTGSSSERQIISTTVQLMRVKDQLATLDPVTVPTNDMAVFPSPEHSLFPDYLDRRYSQFEYTVDEQGIVTVHTGVASTDTLLDSIKDMIPEADTTN